MKDLIAGIKYDASKVISQAVGPSKEFCMGYMNPGAHDGQGYISTLKLSVGTVDVKGLDEVTESILAYERCGKSDAYCGQVNMQNTSSAFCGLNGAIWGLDLGVHEDILSGKIAPMYKQPMEGGKEIPVYNARPLLDATERLFGKEKQRRFPPMPGSYIVCAGQDVMAHGPQWVWGCVGVAVPKNRDQAACLFVEDANVYGDDSTTESEMIGYLEGTLRRVTESIALCAEDQGIEYECIYAGYKYVFVEPDQVGCAMTTIPAVYLAQNAVPQGMDAAALYKMPLTEWEKKLGLEELTFEE
ncbi:histidine decarboxylase [Oscillospiraceae bacterium N12]|jgi:histidine decarboxylase|uniref:Histidine decarboxylase proenzyme n=1 Tax=Jilunia laotingensis TaxID=2763675 RepID=A0A926F4A1_9BACT|nr:histidine decarboxylase, pyruvoyl type [Jilunia laotingensis]MBC8593918.1 histidine decarboxylase [Jilunia laotingensis]